jgi:hypothetical protein
MMYGKSSDRREKMIKKDNTYLRWDTGDDRIPIIALSNRVVVHPELLGDEVHDPTLLSRELAGERELVPHRVVFEEQDPRIDLERRRVIQIELGRSAAPGSGTGEGIREGSGAARRHGCDPAHRGAGKHGGLHARRHRQLQRADRVDGGKRVVAAQVRHRWHLGHLRASESSSTGCPTAVCSTSTWSTVCS